MPPSTSSVSQAILFTPFFAILCVHQGGKVITPSLTRSNYRPIRTRSTPRTLQFTHDPHIQRKDVVIGAGHDIGTTSGVASTDACCAACKGKNGCKAWTYHASTKVCWYVPQTRRRSEILTLARHRCCCRAHTAALTHFIPFSPQVPRLYRRQPTRKGSHLGRPLRPAAPRPAASRTHGCPQRP